jgi:hypothetical protein
MPDVAGRLRAPVAQVRGWEDHYRRLEELEGRADVEAT